MCPDSRSFDTAGQLTTMVEGDGSAVARTSSYIWNDALNLPQSVTVAGIRKVDYVYTATGRVDLITVTNLSAIGVQNQTQVTDYDYTYHPNGMVETMTVNGPLPGNSDRVISTFSALGDLLSMVNGIGETVTYSDYNGFRQPGVQTGSNGEQFGFFYDDRGRLTRVTTRRDPMQPAVETVWVYAANGLLESVSYPDGVTEVLGYDGVRRLETITRTDADGEFQRKMFYDAASNVLRGTESIKFDNQYRLYFETFSEFDEQNRLRERRGTPAQFGSAQYRFTYRYDLNSNVREIEAINGGITQMTYDALDRLAMQTDATSGETVMAYDALDQPTSVRNPRLQTTSYTHDGFGQLWSETSPDTGATTHVWNVNALRDSSTLSDGTVRTYFYDSLSRLERVRASRDSGFEERTFVYGGCTNGAGRLCQMNDANQSLRFNYKPYGELAEQRNQIGATTYVHSFEHDNLGRLTGIVYPDSVRADYIWGAGRAKSMTVTINGTPQTLISDARRRWFPDSGLNILINEHLYTGERYRRALLDRNGRIAGINTEPKQGLGYRFDADSRIERLENLVTGDIQSFGYDGVNRLT